MPKDTFSRDVAQFMIKMFYNDGYYPYCNNIFVRVLPICSYKDIWHDIWYGIRGSVIDLFLNIDLVSSRIILYQTLVSLD